MSAPGLLFPSRPLGHAARMLAALVLALACFASGALGVGAASAASEVQVIVLQPNDLLSWRYDPAEITIPAGTTVTWVNQGSTPVTVTSPDGLFDSDQVLPGASFSLVFDTPGTFRYFCVPYPHMKGAVVVTR